jgi:ribonuclease VapC
VTGLFVDASVLVAVILRETGYQPLEAALASAKDAATTEFAVMETGLAIMREARRSADDADRIMRGALAALEIAVVPLTAAMILTALQAYERYGKGREHPARLNMGDCLSYGAARTLGLPLLYKGEDFARTDIASALPR